MKKLIFLISALFFSINSYAAILFQDNFEYQVDRDGSPSAQVFVSSGGWDYVKSMNDDEPSTGSLGYLYTSTSIPGFSGSFPGTSSNRVLCMEGLSGTYSYQTDFYVQIGNDTPNEIPGDVWFQFWIYINYYGTQLSQIPSRNKFLYPSNNQYGSTTNLWLWFIGADTYEPFEQVYSPSNGDAYLIQRDANISVINYTEATYPSDIDKLGQTTLSPHIEPNGWYLVKIHFDTTHTSGNSYEAWLTPQGGSETKVAEWIGGVTPNFTWTIPEGSTGGHRTLRMPSTWPGANNSEYYDTWIYMDDFVMAESEGDLPTYGSETPQPSVTNASGRFTMRPSQ